MYWALSEMLQKYFYESYHIFQSKYVCNIKIKLFCIEMPTAKAHEPILGTPPLDILIISTIFI